MPLLIAYFIGQYFPMEVNGREILLQKFPLSIDLLVNTLPQLEDPYLEQKMRVGCCTTFPCNNTIK